MMMFKRTMVATAITTALAQQAIQARTRAENERRQQLKQAIAAGLEETDKKFSGGLLSRFRAGLSRLRGKS